MGKDQSRRKLHLTAHQVCLGLAMACNTAWVSMSFKCVGIYSTYTSDAESLLDSVYLISIVIISCLMLLCTLLPGFMAKLMKSRGTWFTTVVGVCLSTVAMALAGTDGLLGTICWWFASVGSGIFSGLLLIYIGMEFSRMRTYDAFVAATIGFCLAPALFSLLCLVDAGLACAGSVLMIIATAFLLHQCSHMGCIMVDEGFATMRLFDIDKELDEEISRPVLILPEQHPFKELIANKELLKLVLSLAVCSLLVGLSNEISRTLYTQMGLANSDGATYAFAQTVGTLFMTVGAVALTLISIKQDNHTTPVWCYRLLFLFLVLGTILLPSPVLIPEVSVTVPYCLNTASYNCFAMLIWIICAGICNRYPQDRMGIFGLARFGWSLGPLGGILIGRYLLSLEPEVELLYMIMVACVVLILLASSFSFTETTLVKTVEVLPTEPVEPVRRRFHEACDSIAAEYGLSERELEVMCLFGKGHNLAFIQESLCLSKSTVSTHRQHIYQKLNVHSQQELIELIDTRKFQDDPLTRTKD